MPIKGYDCNSSFEIQQNFGKTITSIILCVPQPTVLRAYYSKFKVASTGSLKVSLEPSLTLSTLFKIIQRLTQARYVVLQLLFNFMRQKRIQSYLTLMKANTIACPTVSIKYLVYNSTS